MKRTNRQALFNDRIKLVVTTINAMAIGVLGLTFIKPIVESETIPAVFVCGGLLMHAFALYILRYQLEEEPT